jgi:hypothetical protein
MSHRKLLPQCIDIAILESAVGMPLSAWLSCAGRSPAQSSISIYQEIGVFARLNWS